jgi:hypothetical protein
MFKTCLRKVHLVVEILEGVALRGHPFETRSFYDLPVVGNIQFKSYFTAKTRCIFIYGLIFIGKRVIERPKQLFGSLVPVPLF